MDLSKILSISGKPGLYQLLTQTKTGFVVESLIDGKRFPVFAHEKVSSLEEISIFSTEEEDLPLKDVLLQVFNKLEGKPGPDTKADNETLKKFFQATVPTYDPERVYVSDMKKVASWYNLLLEKGMITPEDEEPAAPAEETPSSEESATAEGTSTEETA